MATCVVDTVSVDRGRSRGGNRSRAERAMLRVALAVLLAAGIVACLYWDLVVALGLTVVPRLAAGPLASTPAIAEWILYLGSPWALAGFALWFCLRRPLHWEAAPVHRQ
jgi:hypothetical protein